MKKENEEREESTLESDDDDTVSLEDTRNDGSEDENSEDS